NNVTFPAEAKWEDGDYAASMTERVLDQLAAHGTTAFAGYATVHHEATRRAMRVCADRGVRAAVGQVLMDQQAPDDLLRPVSQLLREARLLQEEWVDTTARIEAAVTPRFAVSCSLPLLAGAGQLAGQSGAMVQTHLAEMLPECELAVELHGTSTYTRIYDQAGLLTRRSVLAHGIWLNQDEMRCLARAASVIAHCPTANTFLQSGTMSRQALHEAGIRTTLGSDIGGGTERSMVRIARAMIDAAKSLDTEFPDASECWHQITAGNADALGWPNTSRLVSGAEADVLVVKPDVPWRDAPNPLSMLLYTWDDRWLKQTIVAGQIVFNAP
ncbi:MAG: amidohydrolase family protein, partial [Phycisphaeraceae bacterium]